LIQAPQYSPPTNGVSPVPIPPNFTGALVADPNNFFLTPLSPPPLKLRLPGLLRAERSPVLAPSF